MSSNDIAIRVSNLSKRYEIYGAPRDRLKQFILPRLQRLIGKAPKQYFREFWALKDVSFEIKKGETFGIIGDNGSGKSTLLQMICGTLTPSGGIIRTNGRIAALLELGSGFNSEFTGRENVYLNGLVLGLSKEEIDARFDDIAAFADIGEFIDQPVKTYSSGMYVRLAFAVIANIDAEILLIDEALAVGDVHFSQKCMRFLDQFREKGALLFVSHNSEAVISLCSNSIWLEKGLIKAIGTAKQVTEKYLAHRYKAPVRSNSFNSNSYLGSLVPETITEGRTFSTGRDMRNDFINHSNLRNDLQLFDFDKDACGFGLGGAAIVNVQFLDSKGNTFAWIVGGEEVGIVIEAEIQTACTDLIVGFHFKNALGQILFGQNTYLPHYQAAVSAGAGEKVKASFKFRMPLLPLGTYTLDVAIADGIPPIVKQLQWLHDALVVKSHTTSVVSGLIGQQFEEISLNLVKKND